MKNVPGTCPFCGHLPDPDNYADSLHPTGSAWREDPWGENGEPVRHYLSRNDPRGHQGLVWEMGCVDNEGGCGATMYGDSREECVANWNRRPPVIEFTDEQISEALRTKLGLDHTLFQLIRGDTMAVGYGKNDVVRALLSALNVGQNANMKRLADSLQHAVNGLEWRVSEEPATLNEADYEELNRMKHTLAVTGFGED